MHAEMILLMVYMRKNPFLSKAKAIATPILSIKSEMHTTQNDTCIEDLPRFMMYRRNDPAKNFWHHNGQRNNSQIY